MSQQKTKDNYAHIYILLQYSVVLLIEQLNMLQSRHFCSANVYCHVVSFRSINANRVAHSGNPIAITDQLPN